MLKFLIIGSLLFTESSRATEAVDSTTTPFALCERLLEVIDATSRARLKLTLDNLRPVAEDDPELITAIIAVVESLDDRTLEKIAINIVENPEPMNPTEFTNNPFYTKHPRLRREYARKSIVSLEAALGDQFDDYELGLLSYAVPDLPRVDFERASKMHGMVVAKRQWDLIEVAINSEIYRPILIDFLERIFARPWLVIDHGSRGASFPIPDDSPFNASGNSRVTTTLGLATRLISGMIKAWRSYPAASTGVERAARRAVNAA